MQSENAKRAVVRDTNLRQRILLLLSFLPFNDELGNAAGDFGVM